MKQSREHWSWRSTAAPLVFGVALALVVASCGQTPESPVSPSGARSSLADTVPDPTPDPDPDPTPDPTPDPDPEPTPGGGEGCTPGYWKQAHHEWPTGYAPGDLFDVYFENAFPGKTLDQVLGLGGGGLNALGRHIVAALLNAASDEVDYDMSVQEVIDAFNAVFPGGDYESLKNDLDFLNNLGCPL